ncbi:MAG: PAS domain S-box protein [Opitutae bacterium]
MAFTRTDSPRRLTAAYVLFATLWILGSDGLAALLIGGNMFDWLVSSFKGLLFVTITGVMLYLLTKRLVRQQAAAAAALRENQQRLELTLAAGNLGLYDYYIPTDEVEVNATYARMLGYEPTGFRETFVSWTERLHPGDRDLVIAAVRECLEGLQPELRIEYRLRTKQGEWLWILSFGRIVERDATGWPLRLSGTNTDITDLKSAEMRTMDALSFAKTVMHTSPVGVLTFGPTGKAVTANEAAAQISGTAVPDLLRQNFRELDAWRQHGLLAAAERALATGQEIVHRGPYPSPLGRTSWIEARFKPFYYQNATHLLVLLSDETEQRQATENLQLLNAAVQAATSGWVITDERGVVEFVNPGFTVMTGYTAAEAVGRKTSILKSGRQSAAFYTAMWETIRRGEVWHGELENCRKDGTFYHEQMTIAPIRDAHDRITHYVAIKHDISGQKKLEQQMARAQRLESIGLLASGLAHDLNNILAPISLASELLKVKYPEAGAEKTLEMIFQSAQRGAGVVRQVLAFARGIDGARTEVQPKHLLKDIAGLVDETFPRNIQSQLEIAPDVWPVTGDITQLHQVLLNLAVNARDAMPDGGVLRLGASNVVLEETRIHGVDLLRPGRYVALTVTDSGTGISPEVMERMFEPFYTTKPQGKGTGLGLSTVYGLIRSHEGMVEVTSVPGAGTEFRVLLPAAMGQAPVAVNRREVSAAFPGEGRRLLIVDDEEAIRLVSEETLRRHGFVVETAVDGVDGLEKFRNMPGAYAAVVTDIMMPRMNGFDMARNIHQLDSAVPIIASSGMAGDTVDTSDAGLAKYGIRTLLLKPYNEDKLLNVLAKAFNATAAQKKG